MARKSSPYLEVIIEYALAGLAWALGDRLLNLIADRLEKYFTKKRRKPSPRRRKPTPPPSQRGSLDP